MISTTTPVDTEQVERWHSLIIAPLVDCYPTDALLALSGPATGWSALGHRVPLADPAALVDAVQAFDKGSGVNVFVGVAPVPGADLNAAGRGAKGRVLGLPALIVDLDINVPGHAAATSEGEPLPIDGAPLPTESEATEIIARLRQCVPLMDVHTGGGHHLWVPLAEPLDHRSDVGKELLDRWKSLVVQLFADAGRSVDSGPLADAPRVLRVPGTRRVKPGCDPLPVRILSEPSARSSVLV